MHFTHDYSIVLDNLYIIYNYGVIFSRPILFSAPITHIPTANVTLYPQIAFLFVFFFLLIKPLQ